MRSVMALATLCVASLVATARADIIYQDLGGLPVTADYNDVPLDMDLDGIPEVFARYFLDCDSFMFSEYASVYFGTAVDRAFIVNSNNKFASGLAPTSPIGPSLLFKPTGCLWTGQDEICDSLVLPNGGEWTGIGTTKYIGVRVVLANGSHYGWVRVQDVLGTYGSFRVLDCAMETDVDVPILAGDTGGCAAIHTQPQDTHALEGHDLVLSVVTTGQVNAYKWFKNGVPLLDGGRVSGSGTRRLTIRGASPEEAARYHVAALGPCGSTLSNEVSVWIDPVCRPMPGWEMAVDGGLALVNDSPDLRPGTAFSVELWFNPTQANTNPVLASKGGRDWCTNHTWSIEYDGAAIFPVPFCLPEVTFTTPTGCKYAYVVAATGDPNQWIHIAMTVDTEVGVLKAFVNGQFVSSTTTTSDSKPIKGLTIASTQWPLSVGRVTQDGEPVAEPFYGSIDDVRIWSVARTPAEIAQSYASSVEGHTPGLAAAYSFDNPDHPGTDITGKGNDAEILPGATVSESIACCPADIDDSGFADTDDFTAFVAAFDEGDVRADFDRSGFVDTDDFTAFVVSFEAGC